MKILVLLGSHRRNGNTDHLVKLVMEHVSRQAEQAGVGLDVETVYLGQRNLKYCRGCRICYDRGEQFCPVKDDLLEIKSKMLAADGVLLASPVYVDDVSAITKNLIDRLCHVCHRPEFAGRVACLVATTGSSPTGKTLGTMSAATQVWGFHIAGRLGCKMGALMKADEVRPTFDSQAERLARQFFSAIHEKQYLNPSLYALAAFKIQQLAWQREPPGSYDKQYWENTGWLDPRRTYYLDHKANPIKVWFARLCGALIAPFVSG